MSEQFPTIATMMAEVTPVPGLPKAVVVLAERAPFEIDNAVRGAHAAYRQTLEAQVGAANVEMAADFVGSEADALRDDPATADTNEAASAAELAHLLSIAATGREMDAIPFDLKVGQVQQDFKDAMSIQHHARRIEGRLRKTAALVGLILGFGAVAAFGLSAELDTAAQTHSARVEHISLLEEEVGTGLAMGALALGTGVAGGYGMYRSERKSEASLVQRRAQRMVARAKRRARQRGN